RAARRPWCARSASEHPLEVFELRRGAAWHDDGDRIDADAIVVTGVRLAPRRRESPQARELLHRDGLERMPERDARARLDLDEHGLSAVEGDDVDLALRAAPIPVEDRIALPREERRSELLALLAQQIFRGHGHLRLRGWQGARGPCGGFRQSAENSLMSTPVQERSRGGRRRCRATPPDPRARRALGARRAAGS